MTTRSHPRRRRRVGEAGQALAEYGLVLALVSGVNWVQGLGRTVAEQPLPVLVGGVAGVLLLGYVLLGPRR
jgi:hypothetical protein